MWVHIGVTPTHTCRHDPQVNGNNYGIEVATMKIYYFINNKGKLWPKDMKIFT